MELQGKTAIVTGSARGIGFEIAMVLAREGAFVVLVDQTGTQDAAISLQEKHYGAMAISLDITDLDAVNNAVKTIVSAKGRIDILVNNAGIIARGSIIDLSREQWLRVMDVNVNGNFYFCKAILPYMIRQHSGNIVNITSIAGKMGDITAAPVYGASKGAINAFTKSLARQLAEYGIRVKCRGSPCYRDQHELRMDNRKEGKSHRCNSLKENGQTRRGSGGCSLPCFRKIFFYHR